MNPLILLTTLFSVLAFGAALPANAAVPAVTVAFARNTQCAAGNIPEASVSGCVTFPPGTQSLRVTGVHGDGIRYNSLRVYNSADCSGGWSLEPALTCARQGGHGCGCSQVRPFGSIQLVIDS